jgi:hypothetical protein
MIGPLWFVGGDAREEESGKEGCSFFEKKEPKKLLPTWRPRANGCVFNETDAGPRRSFLLLFPQKEDFTSLP